MMKTICIVGAGLIGGSMALSLKERGFAKKIIGVDKNTAHLEKAKKLGIVDEAMELVDALSACDVVVLSIPVDAIEQVLPVIMNLIDQQIVIDVGSIKKPVIDCIKDHPKRKRFVASHPMWGTEYSGPEAAVKGEFRGKTAIICNKEESDDDAVELTEELYRELGMSMVYMEAGDHDMHVAYISHISHVASFALANTVLEKEKEEEAIFQLASGGFETTVRLAKSCRSMWLPIIMQNKNYLLEVLKEYISQLEKFKTGLENNDDDVLSGLIVEANRIRKILK